MDDVHVSRGLADHQREPATYLFWQAFGSKFRRSLGRPDATSREFLARTFDEDNVALALAGDEVLGFVGFSDVDHPMKSDEWSAARSVYGLFGAARRMLLLATLEHRPPPNTLYVEWIAVSPSARGLGVGTMLMAEVEAIARERGLGQLELDVVDFNPRARALYERLGYVAGRKKSMGPFKWLYGFGSYIPMRKTLKITG